MSHKGKRVRLTLGEKREIIDLVSTQNYSHKEVAAKFKVGRSTISSICKHEDHIRTETNSASAIKKKRKTTRCSYDMKILDEVLHSWRMEMKVSVPDTKMTGAIIQAKATEFAQKILDHPYADLPDKVRTALLKFTASNGWLEGFRSRYGEFSSRKLGDGLSIKNVDVDTRKREILRMLDGVAPEDIWSASEFALFYRATSRSLEAPKSVKREIHRYKDRITGCVVTNAAGEIFDIQIIGQYETLAGLKSVDCRERYGMIRHRSKTGWQVPSTMVKLVKLLNLHAKAKKRIFHLILDSSIPHVKAAMMLDCHGDHRTFFVVDHVRIHFLPPSARPSRTQPCHMGVIEAIKATYRRVLLDSILVQFREWVGEDKDPKDFDGKQYMHIGNVLHWLAVARQSIPRELVQRCWADSGLLPSNAKSILMEDCHFEDEAINDLQWAMGEIAQESEELYTSLQLEGMNARSLIDLDENAEVVDNEIDEKEIIQSALSKLDFLSDKKLIEEEQEEELPEENCPSAADTLTSMDILKRFLQVSDAPIEDRIDIVVKLNAMQKSIRGIVV